MEIPQRLRVLAGTGPCEGFAHQRGKHQALLHERGMVFSLLSKFAPTLYKVLATGAVKAKLMLFFGVGSLGAYKLKEWSDARAALGIEGMTEKQLATLFKEIDTDSSGSISRDELQQALKVRGLAMSPVQISHLMSSADANGDGQLDQAEFVAALGKR